MHRLVWNICLFVTVVLGGIVFGYPLSVMAQHGANSAAWPAGAIEPAHWFSYVASLDLPDLLRPYWLMLRGRSQEFAGGGRVELGTTVAAFMIITVSLFRIKKTEIPRDPSGIYGAARWATAAEIGQMDEGLELGIDKTTRRAVRVSIEGNLLTIAPPRKGKTSGLLIPNLAYPELAAWLGPAVVIDPKGDAYRAVAGRRRQLGRTVRCVDPLQLVGGTDSWNPLENVAATDILYLQHTARMLLPEPNGTGDGAAAYFNNRAVDLILGAMLVALHSPKRDVPEVWRLLNNEDDFIKGLQLLNALPAAQAALKIMESDPKARDTIVSTASQAFAWLNDARPAGMVSSNSFDLRDLTRGDVDLFVAVPSRDNLTLAPFLRWLLGDIFDTVREHHPAERMVIFIDEASTLGRFDAILKAAGELPGHGASLWTIWQDRAQIVTTYGEPGARTLLSTADIVTLFDVPATDPDESDRWSRALGSFSALIESHSTGGGRGTATTSTTSQETRLMTKEELTTLDSRELIVFPNSRFYTRHPFRLRKTAFDDPRFDNLIIKVPPVARI
ncbi:type IV secretory system conjugative DNA transfer family protein [Bradyrhizobium liaoningense]|uniref:type IV secretory system conjugative DNA transfer family protein n=1 Tax=Bradyrhizobium liaoningense TaxID=43992 RepID=UPI0004B77960|nr:type IV secretory system conjugative DNA transfer family protein [Bradyrhizobium liaoningense]